MILEVISYIVMSINNCLINMSSLMIDTYVSYMNIVTFVMIMTIILWIIRGLIRHNGNS